MPEVFNARNHVVDPVKDVYVGRPSRWGNPFRIGSDGNRSAVITKYFRWVRTQTDLMAALHELRGKNLVCWCAPHRCHADVLLVLANGLDQFFEEV